MSQKELEQAEREATAAVACAPAAAVAGPARRSAAQTRVDWLHHCLTKAPPVDCPVTHVFTPGLYTRQIFMPKGTVVISRVHKTEHPYVISQGRVSVWTEEAGVIELKAPHLGVTKPSTRRVLIVHEDTIWATFHVNPDDGQDLQALEDRLTHTPDVSYMQAMEDKMRELGVLKGPP